MSPGRIVANAVATFLDSSADWAGTLTVPIGTPAGSYFLAANCSNGLDLQNYNLLPFTVTASATQTALTSSATPSTYGRPVSFTATVSSNGGTPPGTVIFTDGSSSLGYVSLNAGTATLTTSDLSVGSHSIGAAYSGDPNNLASSASLQQTVNKAATKLTGTPASKSAQIFSATITRTDTNAPIAGQTIVFSTKSPLSNTSDTVCTASTGQNGVASCKGSIALLDMLADSTYSATYSGDASYLPSSTAGALS